MIELSIVVPIYNEEAAIPIFLDAVRPVVEAETSGFEVLFIDDGSSDGTAAAVLAAREADERVRLLRLSRNFGKEAALTAGLDHAVGAAAIPMDVDLQDPPSALPEMIAKWRAGADVVLARRRGRDGDGLAKRSSAVWYYRLIRVISGANIPENVGDFRLLDRKALDALAMFPERSRFMKGVFALLGFETAIVEFDRPARATGEARQNWRRLLSLALEGVISFSVAPLRIWTLIGLFVAATAALYGIYIILNTLLFGVEAAGFASIITVSLFMNGLVLIGLGVIGEYVSRIFTEVKRRPLYLVRESAGVSLRDRSEVEKRNP